MDCNKGFHFEYPYLVGSPWDEEAEPRLLSDDTAMPMILPTTPAETDLTEMSAAVARCSSGNWTPLQYACPSPKEGAPAILSLAPWKALAISLQVLATVSGRSTRLISLSSRSAAILHPLRIKDLAPSSMLGQFQRRRKNNLCRWASGDTSAPWTNDSGKNAVRWTAEVIRCLFIGFFVTWKYVESFQLLMSSPNLETGLPRTMCGGSLDVHDHSSTCKMTGIYRVFQETRAGLIKTKQRYPETRKGQPKLARSVGRIW